MKRIPIVLTLLALGCLPKKDAPPPGPRCPPAGEAPAHPNPDDPGTLRMQRGPGCVELWLDERVTYPVARPEDLPLVKSGEVSFEALAEEGLDHWFFTAQLEGEPFGVPAELMDKWVFNKSIEDIDALFDTLENVWKTGLVHFSGEELPRGLVRMEGEHSVVTQNCSACHSGVVNGKLIPGIGNKWYNQKQIINFARGIMDGDLPEPGENDDLRNRVLAQQAKLERYDALYGANCVDLAPGMITAARIWEISSKLLHDPQQLTDEPSRFLCGATKPPPLNTVRFRNLLFWDGAVTTLWVTHWPMFDFFGFDDYSRWANKIVTREIQAMDASIIFKSPSPSWEEVMETPVNATRAARGRTLFHAANSCASCHGTYGDDGMLKSFAPSITPLHVIGTDEERTVAATDEVLQQFTPYNWAQVPRLDVPGSFVNGYAPFPLCSTFLNFPYLHTAGVANLKELLTPEMQRSRMYWQSDVTDDANVGYFTTTDPPALGNATPAPRLLQRTFRDSLVMGHSGERFGTQLGDEEKMDLIEFLKTTRCPVD